MDDDPFAVLTPRQRQALELACELSSAKEAARAMGIRYETAKNHLHDAYVRMGLPGLPTACLTLGEWRGRRGRRRRWPLVGRWRR